MLWPDVCKAIKNGPGQSGFDMGQGALGKHVEDDASDEVNGTGQRRRAEFANGYEG
ncbi:unnamed protein product [Protopolystoma xenopodis]|uniref:Uncharacterized protein n=1 Tax=Protopolystoma xenopodis TaxID=117903 RepID=A0A3S5CV40_9PLAT|nr:unnamed protein product [Protopolystoma xenopodis]